MSRRQQPAPSREKGSNDRGGRPAWLGEQCRRLIAQLPGVAWVVDAGTGELLRLATGFADVWEALPGEGPGGAWSWAVHPEDRPAVAAAEEILAQGGSLDIDYRLLRPDGSVAWVRERACRLAGARAHGGILRVAIDTTAETLTDELRAEVSRLERDSLRRVPDCLQTVCSLLGLQARHAGDQGTRDAIEEAAARVRSIAAAHRLLGKAVPDGGVAAGDYLEAVVEELLVSEGATGRVSAVVEADGIRCGRDEAICLALLVSECVSELSRRAFGPSGEGRLRVSLSHEEGPRRRLTVASVGGAADPGRPLGEGSCARALVDLLARQLGGTLALFRGYDVSCTISF